MSFPPIGTILLSSPSRATGIPGGCLRYGGDKYSSPSAGDLSSFSATAPRPVKIIQLQHPTTSTSSTPPPSSSFLGRWRGKMKRMTWVEWIELFLPCYRWIRTYRWREYLQPDLMSGITVGVMLVPQSMSYAKLAGLHPIYGLYSGFIPIFVYAVFGSSRQLAIGPVALTSLLVSNVLGSIVDSSEALYTELAILLALMAKYFLGYEIERSSKIIPLAKSIILGADKQRNFPGADLINKSIRDD
ncbi:UNVERIFIED_CONTAM: Sulfate transporter 4.1, chloroplastic [Sesamum calycinum]|uniref:Sulfate transporter 4.1, chloroplastic n=1 Tax=Sesamum calycinum TaxID=2727403 RepID=A0AAW2RA52_9LAMI